MIHLSESQRVVLAEKLADFGNIAAGSLIFGAAITERLFVVSSIFIGIGIVVVCYVFALILRRDRVIS